MPVHGSIEEMREFKEGLLKVKLLLSHQHLCSVLNIPTESIFIHIYMYKHIQCPLTLIHGA